MSDKEKRDAILVQLDGEEWTSNEALSTEFGLPDYAIRWYLLQLREFDGYTIETCKDVDPVAFANGARGWRYAGERSYGPYYPNGSLFSDTQIKAQIKAHKAKGRARRAKHAKLSPLVVGASVTHPVYGLGEVVFARVEDEFPKARVRFADRVNPDPIDGKPRDHFKVNKSDLTLV